MFAFNWQHLVVHVEESFRLGYRTLYLIFPIAVFLDYFSEELLVDADLQLALRSSIFLMVSMILSMRVLTESKSLVFTDGCTQTRAGVSS